MLNQIKQNDVVIFDVDDTLCFFTQAFDVWMSRKLGIELPDRDLFPSYDLIMPFRERINENATASTLLKEFEASGWIESPDYMKPTSLMKFARILKDRGTEIHALTARGWMKSPYQATYNWFELQDLDVTVHVVDMHDSKADWLNRNIRGSGRWFSEPKTWIFEDNPTHILDIARNCPSFEMPIIVDQRHNRHIEDADYKRVDPTSITWMNENDETA